MKVVLFICLLITLFNCSIYKNELAYSNYSDKLLRNQISYHKEIGNGVYVVLPIYISGKKEEICILNEVYYQIMDENNCIKRSDSLLINGIKGQYIDVIFASKFLKYVINQKIYNKKFKHENISKILVDNFKGSRISRNGNNSYINDYHRDKGNEYLKCLIKYLTFHHFEVTYGGFSGDIQVIDLKQ